MPDSVVNLRLPAEIPQLHLPLLASLASFSACKDRILLQI